MLAPRHDLENHHGPRLRGYLSERRFLVAVQLSSAPSLYDGPQGPPALVAKNESVASWEALTGITSAITTVVLIATVLMARRQVQLLRRSTQLDGLLRILAEMDHPAHVASYRFTLDELPRQMEDPVFRRAVIEGTSNQSVQQYLPILRFYEKVGSLVKFGLLDPDAVYCQAGAPAVRVWNALQEVIAYDRARIGPGAWDGFEILATGAVRYFRQMNPNFPGPYKSDTSSN